MGKIFMSETTIHNHQSTADVNQIFGLVLAGGKSSRMGSAKGLINYHGIPQQEYLFNLLGKFCNGVYTSCKTIDQMPNTLNPIADQYDIDSPLNGILSAFDKIPNAAWLTAAVDMPLVDEDTLRFLITNRSSNHVATCFYDSEGKNPEPLLTLWEAQAYPLLKEFNNQGKTSPRDFLKQSLVKMLTLKDPKILTNINSIDELNKFKARQF